MSCYEAWYLVSQYLLVFIALGGAIVAYKQLSRLAEAAIIQTDQTMLQHQNMLYNAIQELRSAGDYVIKVMAQQHDNPTSTASIEVQGAQSKLDSSISIYLNALDGICRALLRDPQLEARYKLDYREEVFNAVSKYKDKFGGVEKHYRNILKIYDRWKES